MNAPSMITPSGWAEVVWMDGASQKAKVTERWGGLNRVASVGWAVRVVAEACSGNQHLFDTSHGHD
jgi:hypothetical protein